MKRKKIIEINNLSIKFTKNGKAFKAVRNANLSINRGEIVGLVGESGSGKTTLGKALLSMYPYASGTVHINGRKIETKGISEVNEKNIWQYKDSQLIFQDPTASLQKNKKVLDLILEGYRNFDIFTEEKNDKINSIKKELEYIEAFSEIEDSVVIKEEDYNIKFNENTGVIIEDKNKFKQNLNKFSLYQNLTKILLSDLINDINLINDEKIFNNQKLEKNIKQEYRNLKALLLGDYKNNILEIADFKKEINILKKEVLAKGEPINFVGDFLKYNLTKVLKVFYKMFNSEKNKNTVKSLIAGVKSDNLFKSVNVATFIYESLVMITKFYNISVLIIKDIEEADKNRKFIRKEEDLIIFNETRSLIKGISEMIVEYLDEYLKENIEPDNLVTNVDKLINEIFSIFVSLYRENYVSHKKSYLELYKKSLGAISKKEISNISYIFNTTEEKLIYLENEITISEIKNNIKSIHSKYNTIAKRKKASIKLIEKIDQVEKEYSEENRKSKEIETAIEVLKLVGLSAEDLDKYPGQFSGGQKQRIGIARAVITRPEFIVADEPISALDVSIQSQVVKIFRDLRDKLNLTILFIAHDLEIVEYIADRMIVMYRGDIVEESTSKNIMENSIHPYTKALISASPNINTIGKGISVQKYDPTEHQYNEYTNVKMFEKSKGHNVRGTIEEIKDWS